MKFRIKSYTEHGDEYISEETYTLEDIRNMYPEGDDDYMGYIGDSLIIKQVFVEEDDGFSEIDAVTVEKEVFGNE